MRASVIWQGVELRPRPDEKRFVDLVAFGPFTVGYAQAVEDMARVLDPSRGDLYYLILSRFRP